MLGLSGLIRTSRASCLSSCLLPPNGGGSHTRPFSHTWETRSSQLPLSSHSPLTVPMRVPLNRNSVAPFQKSFFFTLKDHNNPRSGLDLMREIADEHPHDGMRQYMFLLALCKQVSPLPPPPTLFSPSIPTSFPLGRV